MRTPAEPAAVEPDGDAPAIADPATVRALRAQRLPVVALPVAALVFGLPILLFPLGGVLSTALAIVALAFAIALLVTLATTGPWLAPAGRLLRAEPWRPATVRVFRPAGRGLPKPRLVVRDGDRRLNLVAVALPWAVQQVLARTGKVWLVGPDERGWVAIRSTGLALPLGQARVTTDDIAATDELDVVQREPARVASAADDIVLARTIARPLRRSKTELVAPAVLLLFALVIVVDLVGRDLDGRLWLVVLVGVAAAAVVAWFVARLRAMLHWSKVRRLLSSGPWRPLAAELVDRTVTATLVDGARVELALSRAGHALLANIERTGQVWLAGSPRPGTDAVVGLPGYPFLAVAHVSRPVAAPTR